MCMCILYIYIDIAPKTTIIFHETKMEHGVFRHQGHQGPKRGVRWLAALRSILEEQWGAS